MANIIKIKRRASNSSPPSSLLQSEFAFNEVSETLYIGSGNNGSGESTSIIPIGGSGNFVNLTTGQTIGGNKTFTSPIISSVSTGTAPLTIASTTIVSNLNSDYLDGQHGSYYLAFGNFSGNASITQGGTGLTSVGTANQLLGVVNAGGSLEYKTINGAGGISITYPSSGNITITGSGGTVTSVGLSMPSIFTVSNSPVTGSGTLTASLNDQNINLILAGPTSGAAASPTFRSLVNSDLPTSGITAGTWSKITFNDKGIATDGANIVGTDVNSALGYTAANDITVVHLSGNETITGTKTFTNQIISTLSTGTAPFSVSSTTLVTNLNVDKLDGQHGAFYQNATNINTGTLSVDYGGTGLNSVGTSDQILGVNAGGTGLEYKTISGSNGITVAYPTPGSITITGSGGTVTSIGLSLPTSEFTISNSPISSSGTLTGVWKTQTGNTFFASPNGSSGVPTFRAMVAADVPTLTSSKISDFDTQVRTSRLDQMSAPTSSVTMNNQKITNLADPVDPQDAVTKAYADSIAQGLDVKKEVNAATTGVLPANSYLNGVLTATADGALPKIDNVQLAVGNRILVKNEAISANNGIYVVTDLGSINSHYILTRTDDANSSTKLNNGAFTFVFSGDTYADCGFTMSSDPVITIGTSPINWVQFSSAGVILAGDAIKQTGNIFDVQVDNASIDINGSNQLEIKSTWTGQTAINTLGTVTTGSWNANIIPLTKGGTGADLSGTADNSIYKKTGSAMVVAVRHTDYLDSTSILDAGTY